MSFRHLSKPSVSEEPSDPVTVPEAAIRVFFSPDVHPERIIKDFIYKATSPLAIEMYAFTHMPFAQALLAAKNRGIEVRVLMDAGHYYAQEGQQKIYSFLTKSGVPVVLDLEAGMNHSKIWVEKGTRVITGSPNATRIARKQVENFLLIESPAIADIFWAHFDRRWARNVRAQQALR